jgi:hypothetical protein
MLIPAQIGQVFQGLGGYDPALELVVHAKKSMRSRHMKDAIDELEVLGEDGPWTERLRRKEQDFLERVIHGVETGHYFMILGCKVPFIFSVSTSLILIQASHRAGDRKDDHDLRCDAG